MVFEGMDARYAAQEQPDGRAISLDAMPRGNGSLQSSSPPTTDRLRSCEKRWRRFARRRIIQLARRDAVCYLVKVLDKIAVVPFVYVTRAAIRCGPGANVATLNRIACPLLAVPLKSN